MALNFFTQRDINVMSPYEVPEEFINYFDGLSEERKAEIIESRPDLAMALHYFGNIAATSTVGYSTSKGDKEEKDELDFDELLEEIVYLYPEEGTTEEDVEKTVKSKYSFDQISKNMYAKKDVKKLAKGEVLPLEALAIRDGQRKCLLHHCALEEVQLKYDRGGCLYGVRTFLCRECNRLFIEESRIKSLRIHLNERNIENRIYDLDISEAFLRSQMEAIELEHGDKIYIPDVWVDENPSCPIHGIGLETYPYLIKYKDRSVKFTAYFCDKCNKILLRKSKALELEDECADKGVPILDTENLSQGAPKKKEVPKKEIKPDYFIQDGNKIEYYYKHNADCYRLTEEDTIVISDSMYCNLEEHDTEEVMTLIWLNQKKGGRKSFLCLAGYCAQCQKYYLTEEDFKVIYSLGRPEVMVINDLEEGDYQITSGEVFEIEKGHLKELEDNFDKQIKTFISQSDYVNPYAVGSYDDGNLNYAKEISKSKYGEELEKLRGYKSKPYTYRVDITFAGKTEMYYLGAEDIQLDNAIKVISFNSSFGKKLVNYRTLNIIKEGKQYDIKLTRQFDIDNAQLYGYMNLRTDEDIIFRSGITDPFLNKVLNLRKKQHSLVDIIATIQENQNTIVDAGFKRNIIVQGCAGSGKTMVLLHRLSSLKYNHPEFDFDNALILTPNENFNLHIKGLADGLQIGSIERVSVEQYYLDILKQYSSELIPNNKLISEIYVKQAFVDYIYSDNFLDKFKTAYTQVIQYRNDILPMLQGLTESMGEKYQNLEIMVDSEFIPYMKRRVEHFDNLIRKKEKEISDAEETLWSLKNRKAYIDDRRPKVEEFAKSVVQDALPRVYTKIGTLLLTIQHNIDEQQEIIDGIVANSDKVQDQLIPFGKKAKLEELKKELDKAVSKQNMEKKRFEEINSILDNTMTEKSDEEVLKWMRQVMLYESSIQEEVRLCERSKNELANLIEEQVSIDGKIMDAKKKFEIKKQEDYSQEVKNAITYLTDKIAEYTVLGTFNKVFEATVADFIKENKVNVNKGTHRYDLYAQLWFSMKFFKKCLGGSKFICVDEGQDMAFNEYRMIYELNYKDVIFNVYGDTNQLLKPGRGIASWDRLKKQFFMDEFTLNENYRNTNQITRFCNESFDMEVLQTGVDGAKVREIPRQDFEKELAKLNLNTERIAILVPRRVMKRNYLEIDMLPLSIREVIGDKIDNGFISLMYVDEVKGIEFEKVFVVPNKMTRNEKYIAYTRALSELIIVVDDKIGVKPERIEEK